MALTGFTTENVKYLGLKYESVCDAALSIAEARFKAAFPAERAGGVRGKNRPTLLVDYLRTASLARSVLPVDRSK